MTILVTGGAGYIGSHTLIELIHAGFSPIVVDNLLNSSQESLRRVEKITGQSIPFYQTDIRNKKQLEQIFKENPNIHTVIHFAGLKAVGESVAKPLAYYNNNVYSTLVLCEVMAQYGCKNIVFSSSATVYGSPDTMPIKESFPSHCATNPYGSSKVFIEQILQDLHTADTSWKVGLLRYFNPVGAHESGLIGENPKGTPNNLMPYIAQVAMGKQKRLKVFGGDYSTHDGTGVRDYIHVVDLARGHVKAIEYLNTQDTGTVLTINLGTGKGYSVLEMCKAFEAASGKTIPYDIVERRSGDIAICYANTDLAYEKLGWKAQYDLPSMCRDTWYWQEKNPSGYLGE